MILRQGYVLLRLVLHQLPTDAEPVDESINHESIVLPRASIRDTRIEFRHVMTREYRAGSRRLLHVRKSCAVTHEEHKPLQLVRGVYETVRQREYTPAGTPVVSD